MTIYFVQRLTDHKVKIGYSGDRRIRITQLRTDYGAIKVLGTREGTLEEENALHNQFADICIGGGRRGVGVTPSDWFHPAPKLLTYIEANTTPYEDIEEIGMRFSIPIEVYNQLHLVAYANKVSFGDMMREIVLAVAQAYPAHPATVPSEQKAEAA
jgi:hypothetical protein